MNKERLMTVLLGPIVSEKSTLLADGARQYAFKVLKDADKREIARAVETLFEVEVDKVRVLNQKGKKKRFGRIPGSRSDSRKAYVTLKPGQDIQLGGGA